MDELKLKLENLAKQKAKIDDPDFNAFDYSGGNYDDAYSMGCADGEILLARELLLLLNEIKSMS